MRAPERAKFFGNLIFKPVDLEIKLYHVITVLCVT